MREASGSPGNRLCIRCAARGRTPRSPDSRAGELPSSFARSVAAARAARYRASRSNAVSFAMTVSSASGPPICAATFGRSSSLRATLARCACASPCRNRRPAHSSQSMTPRAYRSTRASPESPLATSGATYPGLAKTTPATVWQRRFCPRAVPKSMIFTSPVKLTITFWGDRSRCTIASGAPFASRRSCTWARPSATSCASATASAHESR